MTTGLQWIVILTILSKKVGVTLQPWCRFRTPSLRDIRLPDCSTMGYENEILVVSLHLALRMVCVSPHPLRDKDIAIPHIISYKAVRRRENNE